MESGVFRHRKQKVTNSNQAHSGVWDDQVTEVIFLYHSVVTFHILY